MPEEVLPLAPCVPSFSEGIKYTNPETAHWTKLKMDQERWRHGDILTKLENRCKVAEEICSRNVELARDEHLRTVAYGKACQNHSFDKYDPFKGEPLDGQKPKIKRKKKKRTLRPDTFKTLVIPEIDNPDTLVNSEEYNSRGVLTLADLNKSFPQIATKQATDRESDNKSLANSNFNALCLWKNAAQKLFKKEKKKKQIKVNEPPITRKAKAKQEIERPIRKNIFPGECKSHAALRRFMEHETELALKELTAPKHQKEDGIRKMVQKAQLPEIIQRDKTFSAIVRDFKTYKEEKERIKHRKMIDYITKHFRQDVAIPD